MITFTLRNANGNVKPNFIELKQNADQQHRDALEQLHLKNLGAAKGEKNG